MDKKDADYLVTQLGFGDASRAVGIDEGNDALLISNLEHLPVGTLLIYGPGSPTWNSGDQVWSMSFEELTDRIGK